MANDPRKATRRTATTAINQAGLPRTTASDDTSIRSKPATRSVPSGAAQAATHDLKSGPEAPLESTLAEINSCVARLKKLEPLLDRVPDVKKLVYQIGVACDVLGRIRFFARERLDHLVGFVEDEDFHGEIIQRAAQRRADLRTHKPRAKNRRPFFD
jgi:hypothetical protein